MNGMLIDSNLIANNLRELRLKNYLTQEELSFQIGYSSRTIRRYETYGTFDLCVINDFATFYKVKAIDILFGNK